MNTYKELVDMYNAGELHRNPKDGRKSKYMVYYMDEDKKMVAWDHWDNFVERIKFGKASEKEIWNNFWGKK